jgi:hypothetical protein
MMKTHSTLVLLPNPPRRHLKRTRLRLTPHTHMRVVDKFVRQCLRLLVLTHNVPADQRGDLCDLFREDVV